MKKMDVNKKYEEQTGAEIIADNGTEAREKSRDIRKILTGIFAGLLFCGAGYLLGGCSLLFGAAPLGIALLCSADRKVLYIYAGLCLSAIGNENIIVLTAAYTAALFIRVLTRMTIDQPDIGSQGDDGASGNTLGDILPRMFSENICLRMATACVSSFIIGIYMLVQGGFLYYDLYAAIFSMIASPAAALLYYGLFGEDAKKDGKDRSKFFMLSFAALSVSLSFAARNTEIYGVSLSAFGVMFLTMYVCRRYGIVKGMAVGALCGLAYSVQLSPLFAFAALACGALWRVSVFFASISAFAVGIAWGLYAEGIAALTGLMPAILAAALLFAVLDKLFFEQQMAKQLEMVKEESTVCKQIAENELGEIRLEAAEQKVKAMCEMFSSLSQLFYGLCDRMRKPALTDLRQICDRSFETCCTGCPMNGECWENDYDKTLAAVGSMSAVLHRNGKIEMSDVPQIFEERCGRIADIILEINHNSSLHAQQLLQCDKTEILAFDYESTADLLADIMSLEASEFEVCRDMSDKLCEKFTEMGIGIRQAVAYGDRRKGFIIRGDTGNIFTENRENVIAAVSDICGYPVRMSVRSFENGGAEACLTAEEKVKVSYAKRSVRSTAEDEFCGDTVNIFENGNDCFYSFISDGMGSGRDAAFTSGLCSIFLQKMLSSGGRCDIALRMLNSFLRNKGSGSLHECSATVDLMELDKLNGKAAFYKSGAAPTYVFRAGSLFRLSSHTVPVGIIRELDAKKISFDVEKNDIIIMVSDGVTQGREECPWLIDLLKASVSSESLERISDLIVNRALNTASSPDDISVVVVKIDEC